MPKKIAKDSKTDFNNIAKYFTDEESARQLLESIRWPNGPVCPFCQSTENYKLTPKPGSKSPVRPGVYKCADCRKQFTVKVGTIFTDSRLPLHQWLMAVHLMCSSKKGISAHQLHRQLGVTYKTAWFMEHRIRYAMTQSPLAEKLTGIVEVDETYVGGKPRGFGEYRKISEKTPVIAIVQRDGEVRAMKVSKDSVNPETMLKVIGENVDKSARLMTDGSTVYWGVGTLVSSHETVDHSKDEYVRGDVTTNTVEGWFALLKRGIMGTFHHVSPQHLDRYCNEFTFRYTARKMKDSERTVKALKMTEGKRLFYKDPINKVGLTDKEKNI